MLDVAAWGEVIKTFFVEGGPVGNTSVEEPDVDVVEVVGRVYPFAAAVVDLEAEIWGRSCPESWREIGSDHFRVWELICDIPMRRQSCDVRGRVVVHTTPICRFQCPRPRPFLDSQLVRKIAYC